MVLVAALVEVGLDQTGGLLEGRGMELYSPVSVSPTNGGHRLPAARLVGKLLEGLMEHEPTLKELLDGWSSCWLEVQEERRDLQGSCIQSTSPRVGVLKRCEAIVERQG